MVQTGIYRVRTNAEREVERLKAQGFPAFMTFKDGFTMSAQGHSGTWKTLYGRSRSFESWDIRHYLLKLEKH